MKKYILHILIAAFIFLYIPVIHSAEEEKDRLLVIPLKAKKGIDQDEASLLTDILSTEIYRSGKFTILNRDDMKAVLDENEFELAMGCDDNVCLLENVEKLAVNKIITGNIGKLGSRFMVTVRMINEDGENEVMEKESCTCPIEDLEKTIEKVSYKFLSYLAGEEIQASAGEADYRPRASVKDSSGIELVLVKSGCYQMGDNFGDGYKDEKPVHEVCVNDFYMGKYEVTQGKWEEVMGDNPSNYKNGSNYPVEQVSWDDVQEFIRKLNRKTGRNYRLPTEAEWEYAVRSGGKRERFAGFSSEGELYRYANFCDSNCGQDWKTAGQDDGYTNTSPVGTYTPNGLGLYDMSGNVFEWVQDIYHKKAYRKPQRNNPIYTQSGSGRVIRGGSWLSRPRHVRASLRGNRAPDGRIFYLGFRLARTP